MCCVPQDKQVVEDESCALILQETMHVPTAILGMDAICGNSSVLSKHTRVTVLVLELKQCLLKSWGNIAWILESSSGGEGE